MPNQASYLAIVFCVSALVGCALNTYLGAFMVRFSGEDIRDRPQPHRLWIVRKILGNRAGAILDRRTLYYPFVELGTAFYLTACIAQYGLVSPLTVKYTIGAAIVLVACLHDMHTLQIPDSISGTMFGAAACFLVIDGAGNFGPIFVERLGGALAAFLLVHVMLRLGASAALRQEAIGLGDSIIAVAVGLFLGWPDVLGWVFLSPFAGLITGLLIAIKEGRIDKETATGPMWLSGFLFGTMRPVRETIQNAVSNGGTVLVILVLVAGAIVLWSLLYLWTQIKARLSQVDE